MAPFSGAFFLSDECINLVHCKIIVQYFQWSSSLRFLDDYFHQICVNLNGLISLDWIEQSLIFQRKPEDQCINDLMVDLWNLTLWTSIKNHRIVLRRSKIWYFAKFKKTLEPLLPDNSKLAWVEGPGFCLWLLILL